MKNVILGFLLTASFSSQAMTAYGDLNADLTTILVRQDTLEECRAALDKAKELVLSRNRLLIGVTECKEGFRPGTSKLHAHGHLRYHKYL